MSWREWHEETPLYIQRVFSDLLGIRRKCERQAAARARRG